MNELNYASLEASKKLYEAGIVLETEYFWAWDNDKRYVSCVPRLMNKGGADSHNNVVPAPPASRMFGESCRIFIRVSSFTLLRWGIRRRLGMAGLICQVLQSLDKTSTLQMLPLS
jgi:hypothetical protein